MTPSGIEPATFRLVSNCATACTNSAVFCTLFWRNVAVIFRVTDHCFFVFDRSLMTQIHVQEASQGEAADSDGDGQTDHSASRCQQEGC